MFRKKESKKDYSLARRDVLLPRDKIDEISTILESTRIDSRNFRKDNISTKFQSQSFSIKGTDEPQYFKIETDSMRGSREFYSITKVIFIYLGLYPKDDGVISFRLRSDAYKDDDKQTEFESSGGSGAMWGFVTAMSHCIASEDSDSLFMEIKLIKSSMMDAIVGKVYMLWEFEETDIPLLYQDPGVVSFQFKDLDNRANLTTTAKLTWSLFQDIAKGKKKIRTVSNVLNKNYVEMNTPRLTIDLESDSLPSMNSEKLHNKIDRLASAPVDDFSNFMLSSNSK